MIERIREYLKNPRIALISGLVVGIIIGLPILGWWIFPVQWVDAEPRHLRQDLKQDYLCMTIDSYTVNRDRDLALSRVDSLGFSSDELLKTLDQLPASTCHYSSRDPIVQFAASVLQQSNLPPALTGTQTPEAAAATGGGGGGGASPLLYIALIILLAVMGGLGYAIFSRRKVLETQGSAPASTHSPQDFSAPSPEPSYEPQPPVEAAPIARFSSAYTLGNDLFDESFSIDTPAGEFLGECGVGIAETIGVGEPKKATAFEVWLFDKNDIQTVTKILMSAHAFSDPALRQELSSKGEPVLVEPGKQIVLETATLQVAVQVYDMAYGEGALPPESYFERLTLSLDAYPKSS